MSIELLLLEPQGDGPKTRGVSSPQERSYAILPPHIRHTAKGV
jgi:hypothetical protein